MNTRAFIKRNRRYTDRLRPSGFGKSAAHFLHIGKTGGTAVGAALAAHRTQGSYRIVKELHLTRISDVPPDDYVFFLLRNPITHFTSGFSSRQRQGAPRYHTPWNPQEEAAFTRFRDANALAVALGSTDEEERSAAEHAMRGINHVRTPYWRYLVDEDTLRARADRVLFCGATETLTRDFPQLLERLGLDGRGISLPQDDLAAHRTPAHQRSRLSAEAIENLRRWYAGDYQVISLCDELFEHFDGAACLGAAATA